MTIEEAKTKLCPYKFAKPNNTAMDSFYCDTSDCMAWRWTMMFEEGAITMGYCGMVPS